MMRLTSLPSCVAEKFMPAMTSSAEPRLTVPNVLTPAALPWRSRLRPMATPARAAKPNRMRMSRSSIAGLSLVDDGPCLIDDVLWHRIQILQQGFDRLPADMIDVQLLRLHFCAERRIGHGVVECLAQRFGAISRDVRWCREWTPQSLCIENKPQYLLLTLRRRELHDRRYIRQFGRALKRHHIEESDLLIRDPIRLRYLDA